MDTIEYYKLRDELGVMLRSEIEKSIEKERELQQKYIGLGLKIAIGGLATAVLALGIFGIKSLSDVNSTIANIPKQVDEKAILEIQKRFNVNNPITQYEALLRQSTARGLASSITARAQLKDTSIILDEGMANAIAEAVSSDKVPVATKLSLISSLSTPAIRSVRPDIDQAVLVTLRELSAASPFDEQALLRCLKYFTFRNPARFVPNIEQVYDANIERPAVRIAVARYLSSLRRNEGDSLAKRLEKLDDSYIKFLLHVRNVRNGQAVLDADLFKNALDKSLGRDQDWPELNELIEFIDDTRSAGNSSNSIGPNFINMLRERAEAKGLVLVAGNFLDDDDPFFGLLPTTGRRIKLSRSAFDKLYDMAMQQISGGLKKNAPFDDKLKRDLNFWLPRAIGSRALDTRVGFFVVSPSDDARFLLESGAEIQRAMIGDSAIVSVRSAPDGPKVVLKWRAETGEIKAEAMVGLSHPDLLNATGVWRRWPAEDGLL